MSCFICSSEEAQSEGLGSPWGSVCFPSTINARFPIVGGVRGFAGQLGGALGRWWVLLFHLPGSTEGCCILHDRKAMGLQLLLGGSGEQGVLSTSARSPHRHGMMLCSDAAVSSPAMLILLHNW